MTHNKTARTVAMMMAITIIGKIMGVLRERMQAVHFGGNTAESIAFAHASILPRNFLDIMFAAAFSASFIPVFSMYLETKGKKAAFDLAALFISIVTVLTVGVAVVSMLFAHPIFTLTLRADYLPPGTVDLGVTLLRIMFPLMILSGLAFSFTGILQSLGEFRIPAAMSVVSNGIILLYYFFLVDRFGVYGLAVAFLIGWGAQAVIQLPFLIKHRFKFRFLINPKDPGLRKIAKLALPVMLSSWVLPINILVNAYVASGLYGDFGVNAIHFANTLFAIISGVFILSVSNVIFPKLSRQAAAKDTHGFSETINETVRVLLFFLLPLTFGLMALSEPLVGLILGGGQFDDIAVQFTGTALFHFAIGAVGFGILTILSRACYAMLDGRTPIVAAVAAIIINTILSFALAPHLDVAGPALANAIAQTLGAAILVISLTRKSVVKWPASTIIDIGKMMILALVMFVAVHITSRQTAGMHVLLQVAIPGMVGIIVYLGLAAVLRIKEMGWLLSPSKRR